ncbi:lipid-A-disaccharide synthase [Telmatospirillum siberiense]|uniref:Lipid-A-disaccharide synthase n=1 Tax=Telmatospirillum siberiense TaxID=382514 RepID=A0A2N3PZE3_9PROT|nr:lipid-A-disaccharide synthase [Telmatospirillum siberiense]PKU25784.1 lipid-A-disaccharide synthase [Telmatospirillum siberiense]
MNDPLIYLIAGEPSGDLLAARLMVALKEMTGGRVRFAGIGGEAMREQGMESLFPQADLAVMGLAEVLPRIPKILRRLNQTLADIAERNPAAVVTVDSWGFTGRVAKRLRAGGSSVPRIHYVAPMVWAWKEKRNLQLAGRVDLLLCLLPEEPAYFTKVGLRAVHVGHAVLESGAGHGNGAAFRERHGIAPETPLLCVLPGSRRSETSRLLPVFTETVALLAAHRPELQVVVPTVDTVAEEVRRAVWPVPALVVRGAGERYDAFAACQAALAASGTVALELALARLPMVIGYRLNRLTAMIARRLIKIPFVCLINLLAGRMVVPELLLDDCRSDRLAFHLTGLLDDPAVRQAQLDGAAEALERLGLGGDTPSRRAASEILSVIKKKGPAS